MSIGKIQKFCLYSEISLSRFEESIRLSVFVRNFSVYGYIILGIWLTDSLTNKKRTYIIYRNEKVNASFLDIMTDEKSLNPCQYICPRKQRQCKMFPSTHLSTYCMEHILHDPDLDEVKSTTKLTNKLFVCLGNKTNSSYSMSTKSITFDCTSWSQTSFT